MRKERVIEAIGVPLAPADRIALAHAIETTRSELDGATWDAAWAAGTALPTEQAMVTALIRDESPARTATPDLSATTDDADLSRLSPREVDVCRLLARGRTNRQIARSLSITEKTVGSHVDHIMTKLGLRSRTLIALWAVEHGLTAADD